MAPTGRYWGQLIGPSKVVGVPGPYGVGDATHGGWDGWVEMVDVGLRDSTGTSCTELIWSELDRF